MVREQRRRRYVSGFTIMSLWPLFRYSRTRDAYVLRVIGNSTGPVLRRERRRGERDHAGPERRVSQRRDRLAIG